MFKFVKHYLGLKEKVSRQRNGLVMTEIEGGAHLFLSQRVGVRGQASMLM